jgi:RimJ/RimL family protein N-acetyltransferase
MAHPAVWESKFTLANSKIINFRPEVSSDTEQLWAMFSTLSEATVSNLVPPFTRERIESWTNNINYDDALPIVAVTMDRGNQRIIGVATLKFSQKEVFNHKAELGLTIHDDYQNMKIGTALLNHIIKIAKAKGITKIFLLVNTQNQRAIHIYQKAGFKVKGTLSKELFVNGKYFDAYIMDFYIKPNWFRR